MSLNNSQIKASSLISEQELQEIAEPPKQLFQSGYEIRYWLTNRGKQQFIAFNDRQLLKLRKYFQSLDENGNGSIGVQQLEDPFIAFGLCEAREEVAELIRQVDLDGSGTIEFNQFLEIMTNIKRGRGNENSKKTAIVQFFKKLSRGQLEEFDKSMNFRMNVSQYRRKRLLESIMSEDKQKKEWGSKIMQNFKKQIVNNQGLKQVLDQSKRSSIFINGFDIRNRGKK